MEEQMKIWPVVLGSSGLWEVGEQRRAHLDEDIRFAYVFRLDAERVIERWNWPNRLRLRPWVGEGVWACA